MPSWLRRAIALTAALVVARCFPSWWCGRDAAAWLRGEPDLQEALARELIRRRPDPRRTGAGAGSLHRRVGARHASDDRARPRGAGDVDSGPVLLGVSVAATGFALAPARAFGHHAAFARIYRTTELFGLRIDGAGRTRFATGGPIGNALLLALLTSGPEVAPC